MCSDFHHKYAKRTIRALTKAYMKGAKVLLANQNEMLLVIVSFVFTIQISHQKFVIEAVF